MTGLNARLRLTLAIGVAAIWFIGRAGLGYELVTVGDVGNLQDSTGFGSVSYEYQIGKYEVTIGQYVEFLNSVAKADPFGLYGELMTSDLKTSGIARTGLSGAYEYRAIGPFGEPLGQTSDNRPISFISWFDAARFANWMANGQPAGQPSAFTTEDGAYTLSGTTTGSVVPRNATNPNTLAAPAYFLPNQDEWYKAAYYSPELNEGGGGYFPYATQSFNSPGNLVGGLPNQANIRRNGYALTQSTVKLSGQNYLTDVGAFSGSGSYYGTFDQNGNVHERLESLTAPAGFSVIRGGWWDSGEKLSGAEVVQVTTSGQYGSTGFRLAGGLGTTFFWSPAAASGNMADWHSDSWTQRLSADGIRLGGDFTAQDTAVFGGDPGTVYIGGSPISAMVTIPVPGYRFEMNNDNAQAVFDGAVVVGNAGLTRFVNDSNPAGYWAYRFLGGLSVRGGTAEIEGGFRGQGVINGLSGDGLLLIEPRNPTAGMTIGGVGDFSGVVRLLSGETRVGSLGAFGNGTIEIQGGALDLQEIPIANTVRITGNGTVRGWGGLAGKIDLGAGVLTIESGINADQAKAELSKGRGDGTWNGMAGITSTAVAEDVESNVVRTIGWRENDDGSITFAYAAPGDTNLDGEVNVFDLVSVGSSGTFGRGTASDWGDGDFDYSGVTNIFDVVLANGAGLFGRGSYLPTSPATAAATAVPEPSALLLSLVAAGTVFASVKTRRSR